MFHSEIKKQDNQYAIRYLKNEAEITCAEFIQLLKTDSHFRQTVNQSIIDIPLQAFYFESRVLNNTDPKICREPFYWIASPTRFNNLASKSGPFTKYFTGRAPSIVFPSLCGETLLIVPDAKHEIVKELENNLVHLKQYASTAPIEAFDDFWKKIGMTASNFRGDYWLKTHGHGVNYLHFRIQPNIDLFTVTSLKDRLNCNKLYLEQFGLK